MNRHAGVGAVPVTARQGAGSGRSVFPEAGRAGVCLEVTEANSLPGSEGTGGRSQRCSGNCQGWWAPTDRSQWLGRSAYRSVRRSLFMKAE